MHNWPEGYTRRILTQVDSTLDEAKRIAPALSGREWILALRQTNGRGRRGRAWRDPEGNFASALVMRPEGSLEMAALRSFVAALALYDACVEVTGREEGLSLKWPNDVLLNGGKLAGILLESSGTTDSVSYLAIGIGVNLIRTPSKDLIEPGAVYPVSLFDETGVYVRSEQFLDALAITFSRYENLFESYGFEPIRKAWMSRAAKLGEMITARTATTETKGIFETVSARGNLVLATSQGRVSVASAEVFF